MKTPRLDLLWFVVLGVIAATYLIVFQNRDDARDAAAETELAEQVLLPVPAPDEVRPATVAPSVALTDPAELPATALEEDRAFIGRAFPLLSTWNLADVKPLLAPATVEASSDADLAAIMATLKNRLGTLQYFDEPQPVPMAADGTTGHDAQALQQYQFIAYYDAGAAQVNLILEKQAETSALYSFDIDIPN